MSNTNPDAPVPSDSDRAVARRVLRRIAGARRDNTRMYVTPYSERPNLHHGWARRSGCAGHETETVTCGSDYVAAAVEGAALGRAYAAALRSAK